jgi:hypothetical protein
MSALDDFKKQKAFAVCVDSDGCAMDTMNIKHFRCFGPCMVDEWALDAWREPILERWNVINLFSGTRGINRFKGLAMILEEINRHRLERAFSLLRRPGYPISLIAQQCGWSNDVFLKRLFKRTTGLTMREWRKREGDQRV